MPGVANGIAPAMECGFVQQPSNFSRSIVRARASLFARLMRQVPVNDAAANQYMLGAVSARENHTPPCLRVTTPNFK